MVDNADLGPPCLAESGCLNGGTETRRGVNTEKFKARLLGSKT